MDIKDIFKLENLRVLIVYLTLYIIGRSIYYIVIDQPFAYFESHMYQEMFRQTLDIAVPMFILTIMWPLVLAFLTSLHQSLRLAPTLFYSVVAVHTASCLIAAAMLYSWDADTLTFANRESFPSMTVVAWVTGATIVSSGISLLIYRFKLALFEPAE
jgi:hypothetical protein